MKILMLIILAIFLCGCSLEKDDFAPIKPPTENPDEGGNAENPPSQTNNTMKITIGSTTFTATLTTSATATAFKAMLPLTLTMSDHNNNEKVCSLPSSLITATTNPKTIQTGDIMLYGSSSLVLFYETFYTSYSYTRIGRINNTKGLKTALGKGSATIKFEIDEN